MDTSRWQDRGRRALFLTLALLLGTSAALAGDLQAQWKNGLRLTAEDQSVQIKIGGQVQNDWVFHKADDDLAAAGVSLEDGTEFRRMRISLDGTIHKYTLFKLQYDFASGTPALKDGWVGMKGLPALGTLKVGQFREPIGLDELSSSKSISFVERGLPMAFVPSRKTGIMADDRRGRIAWAAGIFRDTNDAGAGSGSGEYNVTARLVANPWDEDDGRQLLHVGLAGSLRNPSNDRVSYSARPENHLAPKYVDTGSFASDRVILLGVEGAVVNGPVSVQGEYLMSSVKAVAGEDASFAGFYAFGSYFLTGEKRPYEKSSSTFGRIVPREDFRPEGGGPGAWELLLRYSHLDLDDDGAGVAGGSLDDITAGVNWYLNPNLRVALNYVRADLDGVGASDALLLRFQSDI